MKKKTKKIKKIKTIQEIDDFWGLNDPWGVNDQGDYWDKMEEVMSRHGDRINRTKKIDLKKID